MRIHVGDVIEWAAQYSGSKFHALLCDPPYELGFMNKGWDNTGIAFSPATWAVLAEHLYPGAFGMAFASSRGWHRMAVASEDAGLVIHPSVFLLGWVTGQGYPKAARIRNDGERVPGWEGHRYGLQALSPSLEPIVVFQKPYEGHPADCITATGAGALNIDAGRIASPPGQRPSDNRWGGSGFNGDKGRHWQGPPSGVINEDHEGGRWPANVALSHTPDCTPGHCAEGCPVRVLGEQSGVCAVSGSAAAGKPHMGTAKAGFLSGSVRVDTLSPSDSGTAARYFYNADYFLERMANEPPFKYEAKADRWQREAGLQDVEPCTVDDGRKKSIDNAYQRGETLRRNTHPTIKPIGLIHWLASLLLPPDAYAPRRLLVPFSGSGSEMIGAMLAGWEYIQGVEQSTQYAAIASQRIEFWQRFMGNQTFEEANEQARAWFSAEEERAALEAAGQLSLWELTE